MTGPATSPFTMLGSVDANACEGESCLVPQPASEDDPGILTTDEAAAASQRAVTAALDEGASL